MALETPLRSFLIDPTGWAATGEGRRPCSAKSTELFLEDLRFVLGLAIQEDIIHSLALEDFMSIQVVKALTQRAGGKSAARMYNIVAAMEKATAFAASTQVNLINESQPLLRSLKKTWSTRRKEQTRLRHGMKDSITSSKWLRPHEFRNLAIKLVKELRQCDSLPAEQTTRARSRDYHDCLLTAMHCLMVPQRTQVYRQLQLGVTLLSSTEPTSVASSSSDFLAPLVVYPTSTTWTVLLHPAALQPTFDDLVAGPRIKTKLAQELPLPPLLSDFVTNYINRWRPSLLAAYGKAHDHHDYLFLSHKDGTAPRQQIAATVKRTVQRLVGKQPNPHMFRTIVATSLMRATNVPQQTLYHLGVTMLNSPEVVQEHYVLPDRVQAATHVHTELYKVLDLLPAPAVAPAAAPAPEPIPAPSRDTTIDEGKHEDAAEHEPKRRRVWSPAEVEALHEGVRTYGAGRWAQMVRDLPALQHRSAESVKDKWRQVRPLQQQPPQTQLNTPT